MPSPPNDDDNLIPFLRRRRHDLARIEIPAEIDTPEALHQYLKQHEEPYLADDLSHLIPMLYQELKDIDILVPAQQELIRKEIQASGQGELAYIFNILYRKFHLWQEVVTTNLPCALLSEAHRHLWQSRELPELARPDMDELQMLGITVHSPSLEYRHLYHPTEKLIVYAMATPAFQAWFDENHWLTDSLVFLFEEMQLSPQTRFFRFELSLREGEPWNECFDALTSKSINESPIGGKPAQLPPTEIYYDDLHRAYLHGSDATFPQKVVPFR